jgi:hypothetical protein
VTEPGSHGRTALGSAARGPDDGGRWGGAGRRSVGLPALVRRSWPGLVPVLVLGAAYGATLQRSTGNAFSVDTTKFDYLGLVLGTGHAPGYPLYTMANALFVRLVPFGSVALRANLLSAVFAVLACVVLVLVLRELGVPKVLAAGGATAIGVLPAIWRNAVVAEVYSLTALFIVVVLACLLVFDRTGRRPWLRAALLVYALSFAHATSNVLLLPGLLLYLAVRRPLWLLRPREVLVLLPAGGLLALLPYGYLFWRTAVGSPWLEERVTGVRSLAHTISGARFGGKMFAVPREQVVDERLPALGADVLHQFGPYVVLSLLGLVVLACHRPLLAALTAAWAAATAGFFLCYAAGDWLTLLLPVWLVLGLWMVVGAAWCAARVRRVAVAVAVALAVMLPLTAVLSGYAEADRSGERSQEGIDEALALVPDRSLVFTSSYGRRHQFGYRLLPDRVGERRRVWAAKGAVYGSLPEQRTVRLRQYCEARSGAWAWPRQERPVAAAVPRGLQTFVYGHTYAAQVRAQGFPVSHVGGRLYRTSCPGLPPPPRAQ